MITRNWTKDKAIVEEVKWYLNQITLDSEDVFLDLWGNIWSFSVLIADRVKSVYAYEPEPENFGILMKNINKLINVVAYNFAVVWNNDRIRTFYVNDGMNKGRHSLVVKFDKKIKVPCVNINDIIEEHGVNKIKMDIEWWEYELLKSITDFSQIDEIILEYHFTYLQDEDRSKFKEILSILKNNFRGVIYDKKLTDEKIPLKKIHTIVFCSK